MMEPEETISPLKDVWLRPRRVFRSLAESPIGLTDYVLAATLGASNFLAFYRTQGAETHPPITTVLGTTLAYGTLGGISSLLLMGLIYSRIGKRSGGKATLTQVVHVLAYGSVPMAASVGLWVLAALLAGDAAFLAVPRADMEGFPAFLLHAQLAAYLLLLLWSVVLQVMGLSEIQGFAMGKAFGVWLLGQCLGLLAWLFLAVILDLLLSGGLFHFAPDR